MSQTRKKWQQGYGPIEHSEETRQVIHQMGQRMVELNLQPNLDTFYKKMIALDRLTAAAMWLVIHMTYANRVRMDGQPLEAEDFKTQPEGHTGGALNMVPAYAAYMTLNALTGETRAWLMGQGHSVAAVDAINVLLGNMHPEQKEVYGHGETGLNQLVQDFYGYAQAADGSAAAPLGSHVNPHTAGGLIEGGYLGFAELQYVHMPLPGEKLVTFLSDGAAEEQRGSDWIPRWWRAHDTGMPLPIMIANGRRIEQRTQMGTLEGLSSFIDHLKGCGFDPIAFDGRDPAMFVYVLWDMEQRLAQRTQAVQTGQLHYPVKIPYGIAHTTKGFGFYGADENRAHNLPLPANPRLDQAARDLFTTYTAPLWVAPTELDESIQLLQTHQQQNRALERDNALATRRPALPVLPEVPYEALDTKLSPMTAMDRFFVELVRLNPSLRARVGNPDELASNRLNSVLQHLKHRVSDPESASESLTGNIITALNEEAVVSACIGNQAGLNLVASYEAFCVKMLGALRQRIIFARQQKEVGRPAQWLSWPVMATSHTWENGKNQQSHQDTTFAEALLGEMSDVSKVVFPADYNSVLALLPGIYQSRGQIVCMVVPKRDQKTRFSATQAEQLAEEGALVVTEQSGEQPVLLIANGSYQLTQLELAAQRLHEQGVGYRLVYVQEPGRLRQPRDEYEAQVLLGAEQFDTLFPASYAYRVALTHIRPEVFRGHLPTLFPQAQFQQVLGYKNRGGTLDDFGMLFANQSTWAHAVAAYAQLTGMDLALFLNAEERAAVAGKGDPTVLRSD
ncbi:xylulose 5-phosphate 3-epimerase [Paenalcaligenes hominis]|uniref:xylulose 5-phosphate 3-epimerase n=1 Tax=Paenalcaligenes hominis TaxID=643674 RepID=UPI0035268A06